MEIRILEYIEGAKKATGLTVVIDVFRAFTVGCYVINNGASEIIAAGNVETARQLKQRDSESILMGNEMKEKWKDSILVTLLPTLKMLISQEKLSSKLQALEHRALYRQKMQMRLLLAAW